MSVLYGKIDTPKGYNESLFQLFEQLLSEQETANKDAFITDTGKVTYKEIDHMVTSLHKWLLTKLQISANNESYDCYYMKKVSGGDNAKSSSDNHEKRSVRIAICLNRGPELVALILAIWKLHLCYVPLDPLLPIKRTISIIEQSNPQLIIGDHQSLESLNDIIRQNFKSSESSQEKYNFIDNILNLDDWKTLFNNKDERGNLDADRTKKNADQSRVDLSCQNSIACVMFTSSSSGSPVGVQIKTSNLINRVLWQWNEYPYDASDICLWSNPFTFVDSLVEMLCPFLNGVPVVIVKEPTTNPEAIIRFVHLFTVSRLTLVPSFLKLLLDYLTTAKESIATLETIRLWITSHEVLPNWLVNKFYKVFPDGRIISFYGSTEVTGDVTDCALSSDLYDDTHPAPLGCPISNTALIIFGEEGNAKLIVEEGDIGEIGIVGLSVCVWNGLPLSEESENKYFQLSSLYFKEQHQAEEFYRFLTNIPILMVQKYTIVEETINIVTKGHQSLHKCSPNESSEKLRKHSFGGGKINEVNLLSVMDSKEPKKRARASSVCAPSLLPSSSYILADEIELLNKFKGIKAYCDVGILPGDKSHRRGSMPLISDPTFVDAKLKTRFKPNIKTTSELATTGARSKRLSSSGDETELSPTLRHLPSASRPQALMPEINLTFPSELSSSPIQQLTSSISQLYYTFKPADEHELDNVAIYMTGDLGSLENGVLYHHGKKDSRIIMKGCRLDPFEIEAVIESSGSL